MKASISILGAALLSAALAACATEEAPAPSAAAAPDCSTRDVAIYFGSWETELNAIAQSQVSALQSSLAGCTIDRVRIVGLAGAPGDVASNMEVSQRRAETVAAALEAGGWSRSRFALDARGEEGATTSDGMEAPMRRRVEVTVDASAP